MSTGATPLHFVRDLSHTLRDAASALIDKVRGHEDDRHDEELHDDVSPAGNDTNNATEAATKASEKARALAKDARKRAENFVDDAHKTDVGAKVGDAVAAVTAATSDSTIWHVVPFDGAWALEGEGGWGRAPYRTKSRAVNAGRHTARAAKGRLVIHRADGTIQTHHSYHD